MGITLFLSQIRFDSGKNVLRMISKGFAGSAIRNPVEYNQCISREGSLNKKIFYMRLCLLLFISIMCVSCTKTDVFPEDTSKVEIVATQQYTVHQHLTLINEGDAQPDKQNLWVALIQDLSPYQTVLSRTIFPDSYVLVVDEYGNQYAEFDLSDHPAGTVINIETDYKVAINELVYDLSSCYGDLPDDFNQPELHIESANPQIVALAKNLSAGKKTVCEQVRAFYDYVGDELIYTYNHDAWGAQAALGLMGADCTEYASLTIALSRVNQIPSRYYEGLLYLEKSKKNSQIAQTEHAWLDVYLPEIGWMAMDPTLGRSLVDRDTQFAHYTPNHIIVTTGRNPSTLRGSSYWSHLYWPGNTTSIRITNAEWIIAPIDDP